MENTGISQTSTSLPPTNRTGLNRLRRMLLVFVGIATLVAAFYAVEDWRGKRAWEKCKHEIESKGQTIDWSALIPPPIRDDQNFFKAPKMSEWLTGRGQTELTKAMTMTGSPSTLAVANVRVVPADFSSPTTTNDIVVQYDAPEIKATTEQFLQKAIGATQHGALDEWFVHSIPDVPQLPTIFLQTSDPISPTNLTKIFAQGRAFYRPPDKKVGGGTDFRLEFVGTNSYRLFFQGPVYTAAEYLKGCDAFKPKLDLVRTALNRPYARMDGDYEHPYNITIPNFVTFRCVAQNLSQQTQCYFLTQQPDKALDQLTFIHKLCQVLEARPTSRPITLVAAMINIAVQGLYCETIADGLYLHAWNDVQLEELQKQLNEVNVLPFVEFAPSGERLFFCRTLEQSSNDQLAKLFGRISPHHNVWGQWTDLHYLSYRLLPRGWVYQNMVTTAQSLQPVIDALSESNVSPHAIQTSMKDMMNMMTARGRPYNFLAMEALPNLARAMQTAGKNQTLIHLAYLACALERYHLAHNEYPETLNALVPQFADHIPHDLIGGQPLHYRRASDGQFKLYSVGWNDKDDGGTPGGNETGDWVWQYPLP